MRLQCLTSRWRKRTMTSCIGCPGVPWPPPPDPLAPQALQNDTAFRSDLAAASSKEPPVTVIEVTVTVIEVTGHCRSSSSQPRFHCHVPAAARLPQSVSNSRTVGGHRQPLAAGVPLPPCCHRQPLALAGGRTFSCCCTFATIRFEFKSAEKGVVCSST